MADVLTLNCWPCFPCLQTGHEEWGQETLKAPVLQGLCIRGAQASWLPPWPVLPQQLIYDAGVSFMVIMFTWSGLACLIFLNCALNWPAEAFPAPEEVDYT